MNNTTNKLRVMDLCVAAMFAALMAIGANITSMFPFLVVGGVPITLQTFFALLAGLILGCRLGTISMVVYTLVGLVGVPVFAQFQGGFGTIVQPTFGFILSFILTAYITGKMVDHRRDKKTFLIAALVGLALNYLVGTNLMYLWYKVIATAPPGFNYKMAWSWMIVPLPKDIVLSVIAGIISPKIYQAIHQSTSFYKKQAS